MLRSAARPPLRWVPLGSVASTAVLLLLVTAPLAAQTGGDCQDSETGLCLLDDRFRVEVEWTDFEDDDLRLPDTPDSGQGHAVPVSDGAGYLWFFEPSNLDLVVKVVDGSIINGHFWFFASALTNVEYEIRVTDTRTDETKTYVATPREDRVITDVRAFAGEEDGTSGEATTKGAAPSRQGSAGVLVRRILPRAAAELPSCGEATVACVQGERFAVQATFTSDEEVAHAQPTLTTSTSTLLSLFGGDPQVAVKVLDGRAVNGEFWFFATALGEWLPGTLEVVVTDLETGQAVVYTPDDEGLLFVADGHPFTPDPPDGPWLTTAELPGFRFKVRITAGDDEVATRQEGDCIPETLCISGAVPGRSELFLRIVGPKPNGYLWPNIVKFSTSRIEVWAEQVATEQLNYYLLDGVAPGGSELTGFFDRLGFLP